MQKILFFIFVLLINLSFIGAENCKFDIGAGYRQDHFVWELAGGKGGPKVLSRLSWEQLRIFEMTACFKKITCNNIYFRASGDYGRIFHGDNRDSDYRINPLGEVEECTRFDNNGGEGNVWDVSSGIGYFIRTDECPIRVVPLIGYSAHAQNLEMYDGYQSIWLDIPNYPGHHLNKLHSNYRALWQGPWAGVDLYYHFTDRITLTSSLEYHWLHYHAKGHWNLRSDFAGRFHHNGFGQGFLGTLGVDYNFLCGFYLGGYLGYNYFHLNNGKDKTPVFVNTGENNSVVVIFEGTLRRVKWRSFCAIFTAGYNF